MFAITRHQAAIAFRYLLVGALGSAIDLGILYILVEYALIPVIPSSVISFVAASGNNFYWNKRWTFRNTSLRVGKQYTKSIIVSTLGLVFNTILLALFVHVVGIWYMAAKVIASGVIVVWNFTMNKFWTFGEYEIPRPESEVKPSLDLSVVIPAYNEEATLSSTLHHVVDYCRKRSLSYEIIVVDDGSADATRRVGLQFSLKHPECRIIAHERNLGKGASVREGLLASRGSHILFMDADNATPIAELDTFLPWFRKGFDIVIGSRYLPTSSILIAQPWYRVLLGRIGNLLIRLLLLEGVTDTQCGFKAFTFASAHALASRQIVRGWGFDIELLSIGRQMGFLIAEVPVSWKNADRKSRFRPIRDAHRTLSDLFLIKFNLVTKRYHTPVTKEVDEGL